MTLDLTSFIQIGGLLHFGLLVASGLIPQVLDWRAELRTLHPLTRQLVWVHGAFIVLIIIGFGSITTINAASLASGASLLARSLCAFISAFWLARLTLQFLLFNPAPLLVGRPILKIGYHGLTLVFLYLGLIFGWAAFQPM